MQEFNKEFFSFIYIILIIFIMVMINSMFVSIIFDEYRKLDTSDKLFKTHLSFKNAIMSKIKNYLFLIYYEKNYLKSQNT